MTAPADVLIYVQHLLGIGHLQRAALIARGLAAAGQRVLLVSGGLPVEGLELGGATLAQLPPLRSADAAFSGLVDAEGRAVDQAWRERRRDRLLAIFETARPRLLLFEMFPFGRRQLRFELMPLLEAAGGRVPRPPVVCSLRDVLNPPATQEKADWIVVTARRWFDRILVHGDSELLRLEESFPPAAALVDLIEYTGYTVGPAPLAAADSEGPAEVLVSVGGGAVGAPLIEAALAVRPLCRDRVTPWRILVGHNLPEDAFRRFQAAAPAGTIVERARPDFRRLLSRCACSISQAGYNTAMEVLASRRPAVLVPFAAEGEREQTVRADALARKGWLTVVPEAELTAATLARAVDRARATAIDSDRPLPKMDGVRDTVRRLTAMMGARAE